MIELKINKEFRDLIPPLSQEERTQLTANILRDGCRDPIVTWNGTIVDGHNRYEICTANDRPFTTIEREFSDENDVKAWMIRNQFGRRNLNPMIRAELALKLEPILRVKAQQRKSESGGDRKSQAAKSVPSLLAEPIPRKKNRENETRAAVSEAAGVSNGTIHKVKQILSGASPEVIQKVREGTMTISGVYNELRKTDAKTRASMPFSVRAIEKKFSELKTVIHDMVIAAGFDDEDEHARSVYASIDRAAKNHVTLSRKCVAAWTEANKRESSDVEE